MNNNVTSRKAPGPSGNILFGSLKDFQNDAIGFLTRSVQEHGDIVRFRFGPVLVHLVNRPEYVEHVLARGAQRYDKQTRSVSKIRATCGSSLLSSDGEPWLRHRRLIQPAFQPQYLRSFTPVIDASTEAMIESWRDLIGRNQEIDIVSEMMRLTMTIAARIFFESDIGEDTKVIEDSLAIILEDTWRRLESPIDLSVISPMLHRPKFRAALRQIDNVVYRIIEERRRSGLAKDDLLSRLLRAHEEANDTRLSDQELRDAVVTLLLAGHETTANALAWTFYLVSQSPTIEERLCDESARSATSADVADELSLARMVFSEAIRMYPSIWIIERRAAEHDQIGEFSIPRGSTVVISPFLLHRHPEFWTAAEEFDPARFTPECISARPRHAYIPFGLGPHKCIGEHMALMVATRILTKVFRDFRLRLVADQIVKPLPGITLRHTNELRMTLHRVDREHPQNHPVEMM